MSVIALIFIIFVISYCKNQLQKSVFCTRRLDGYRIRWFHYKEGCTPFEMKTVKRDKIPFEISPKTMYIAFHIRYLKSVLSLNVEFCLWPKMGNTTLGILQVSAVKMYSISTIFLLLSCKTSIPGLLQCLQCRTNFVYVIYHIDCALPKDASTKLSCYAEKTLNLSLGFISCPLWRYFIRLCGHRCGCTVPQQTHKRPNCQTMKIR